MIVRYRRPTGTRPAVLCALAALALLAAACAGDEPPEPTTYTASAPVIQPGRPGEPATTVAPGEGATRAPRPAFNAADVAFVQDMIRHHSQAVQMAGLAPERAADARVRALAARVAAVQAPEVKVLQEWLVSRRQLLTDPGGHGHAMAGMATPDQLESLTDARAAAFDELFLTLMVTHHRGAVTMSDAVMTRGTDPAVQELAAEISAGQTAEIGRMLDVRASLR